ncbi:MAG: hypothetical protein ABIC04_00150 [Nanoarchaeota archaeon]
MIVIIICVFLVYLWPEPKQVIEPYSDDPATWIEDKGRGIIEINVDKVTKGQGYIDPNGEQYETASIGTVFDYEGWFKGSYFKKSFSLNDQEIMRIGEDIKPFDNIIGGFVVEKIEEDNAVIYIFLDEDWKNLVNNTMVYWGKSFQNKKLFDFSNEISKGVYMDSVIDDISRFDNNYALHSGGIYVGDIRKDEYSTLIAFY